MRRIADSDEQRKSAESLRLTLEAEQLLERGLADQLLFHRAIELDGSNRRARDMLVRIERGEQRASRDYGRYGAAIAIAALALMAILAIAIRRQGPVAAPNLAPIPARLLARAGSAR